MRRILISALTVCSVIAVGAPQAAAGSGESPHDTCSMPGMVGTGEEDFFPKVGGCVSTVATNGGFSFDATITQAGYNQRCKQLEGLFGGYPMVFQHGDRVDVAENKRECVDLLTFFHTGGLGEG